MSFDPVEFYTVAAALREACGDREAENRTVIGRAYYAAFLVARTYAGIAAMDGTVHELTSRYVSARSRVTANRLDDLRIRRNKADYNLSLLIGRRESGEALKLSKQIQDALTAPAQPPSH